MIVLHFRNLFWRMENRKDKLEFKDMIPIMNGLSIREIGRRNEQTI